MDSAYFFSLIAPPALIGCILFLARNLILTRLKASVEFEFNNKLELIRADLRISEAVLTAQIREKEAEIGLLRKSALDALANRQTAIMKKRLDAIDDIWSCNLAFKPFAGLLTLATVAYEIQLEQPLPDLFRKNLTDMLLPYDFEVFRKIGGETSKPYVSELAWAYFEARKVTYGSAFIYLMALQNRIEADLSSQAFRILKAALPELTETIDRDRWKAVIPAVAEIDGRLLGELKAMINGATEDKEAITKARNILNIAKKTNQELDRIDQPPHP